MSSYYHESWKDVLEKEFSSSYFHTIANHLKNEYKHQTIFPKKEDVFRAFLLTPINKTKVVILGQDPYHGIGQAMGLSFSVPQSEKIPPSLKNIYKELANDKELLTEFKIPVHGNLESWANQGVLLLNAVLTVRANQPGSHKDIGWHFFSDNIISHLSANCHNLVFLLWGNFAKTKIKLIDHNKHLVLTAAHPSPFSASNGFFGCKHFSKTNKYLRLNKISEINWNL
ncbi:MAG: uracil-DNA glycosylase [Bacteroidota bacterium]|jgi:uracil-DNA glycosylase